MGYRLTVTDVNDHEIISATKLYGYVTPEDMGQMKSLKWLVDHHKLDDIINDYPKDDAEWVYTNCWDWSCSAEQILSRQEFCEFIVLYCIDFNRFRHLTSPEYWLRVEDFEAAFDLDYVRIGWW